ncbi:hypothetical protein ACNKHO_19675 [Shigella flexneri]
MKADWVWMARCCSATGPEGVASRSRGTERFGAQPSATWQRLAGKMQKAIGQHLCPCQSAGERVGILAPVEADAHHYMEWGATFVAVGSDLACFTGRRENWPNAF